MKKPFGVLIKEYWVDGSRRANSKSCAWYFQQEIQLDTTGFNYVIDVHLRKNETR